MLRPTPECSVSEDVSAAQDVVKRVVGKDDRAEDQLLDIEKRLKTLEDQLSDMKRYLKTPEDQLLDIERRLKTLEDRLLDVKSQLKTPEDRLLDIERRLKALQDQPPPRPRTTSATVRRKKKPRYD